MPAATTTSAAPAPDDLDDLFNYDVDADVFADLQPNMDAPPMAAKNPSAARKAADLGIDEEIQVVKKRKPIAKLDENRLLSQAGIPKLRRITKERLRFKGKGHEYSDVARILTLYQLWLDDLYPRAKFADGLAIIEKLGHTKRMQIMRREWIKEGKPLERGRDEERRDSMPHTARASSAPIDASFGQDEGRRETHEEGVPTAERDAEATNVSGESREAAGEESLFLSEDEASSRPLVSKAKKVPTPRDDEFDDLDALLAEPFERPTSSSPKSPPQPAASHDDPPEDDLDALLAEDAAHAVSASAHPAKPAPAPTRDDFDDDMDAMAGMDMDLEGGGIW